MIQVVAAIGPLANGCPPHIAHLIMLQGQCCPELISDCILPSDLLRLQNLVGQLRCHSEEQLKESDVIDLDSGEFTEKNIY